MTGWPRGHCALAAEEEAQDVGRRRGGRAGHALGMTTSRRSAVQSITAGTLGALASLGGRSRHRDAPASARALPVRKADARPNIILLVLDDMRADDLALMPAVQELLVAQGTSFTNFLATAPSCAPARASILRGQYPHSHGVLRSDGISGGFARFYILGREQSTVATWLQEAGYRTAMIGKYMNGYGAEDEAPDGLSATYVPPGWDEWAGVTKEAASRTRTEINENGRLVRYRGEQGYLTD